MRKLILVAGILILGFGAIAQTPTLGLLLHDGNTSEGYTLFSPEKNNSVYLINNCGEKINEWTFSEKPGATCYLLENGTLLRAGKDSLEIRDWENNLLWSYATSDNGIQQHHDIEPLPNGNIICVVADNYPKAEIVALGRDSSNTAATFKLDRIVELQPVGSHDANIVWEWKFIDHLIQDFNDTLPNFGVVVDHPELCDLNFDNGYDGDYTHFNAIDYNADLDQILFTARHLSELFIIDHSTTTFEAAGHTGGNSNMGGDFLWRWGNPQVYKQGGSENQKLFKPHDGKWVEPGYTDEGKITVFNNYADTTETFSSICLMTPEIIDGVYSKENNIFVPADYEWSWSGSVLGNVVNEPRKSGTQALPNGNFIIAEQSLGQVSEITKSGEHLWTYKNPAGTIIYPQYHDSISPDNGFFKAEKYPEEFPGFIGQDLTPQGLIEDENSLSAACILTSIIESPESIEIVVVNPIVNNKLQFNEGISLNRITISDMSGKLVYNHGYFNGSSLDINLIPGMYILQLHSDYNIETRKIIVR